MPGTGTVGPGGAGGEANSGGVNGGGDSSGGMGGSGTGGSGTGGSDTGGSGMGGSGMGGSAGAAGCAAVTTFHAAVEADAIIGAGSPGLNFGGTDVANIGVGIMSEGLFRFSIAALPAAAKVQKARLHLSYAPVAKSCAANCGSCANIDAAGKLSAFFLRSDWLENTATWNSPWSMPGASLGGVDRSVTPIVTMKHDAGQDVTFTLGPAELALVPNWRSNAGALSFEIVPSDGAVMIATTKEWVTDNCVVQAAAPHAATFEIDYCP